MEFQSGAPRLTDMSNGVLGVGTVPFPRFQRSYEEIETAGIVTLLAAFTDINLIEVSDVVLGDRLMVVTRFHVLRGAGGTSVEQQIIRVTGPGDMSFILGDNQHISRHRMAAAGERLSYITTLIAEVTTAGDMAIKQRGLSSAADVTIAAGGASMAIWVLPGS